MQIFTYAVIFEPDLEDESETRKAKLIVEPTHILAKDAGAANLQAARAIPSEWEDDLDNLTVVVRPF